MSTPGCHTFLAGLTLSNQKLPTRPTLESKTDNKWWLRSPYISFILSVCVCAWRENRINIVNNCLDNWKPDYFDCMHSTSKNQVLVLWKCVNHHFTLRSPSEIIIYTYFTFVFCLHLCMPVSDLELFFQVWFIICHQLSVVIEYSVQSIS